MIVLGLLSPSASPSVKREANALLLKRGASAFFDVYRTQPCSCPRCDGDHACALKRLSEMFVLERRGYAVDASLQTPIVSLLDELDASARDALRVDTIINEGGRLVGRFLGVQLSPSALLERQCELWLVAEPKIASA